MDSSPSFLKKHGASLGLQYIIRGKDYEGIVDPRGSCAGSSSFDTKGEASGEHEGV